MFFFIAMTPVQLSGGERAYIVVQKFFENSAITTITFSISF